MFEMVLFEVNLFWRMEEDVYLMQFESALITMLHVGRIHVYTCVYVCIHTELCIYKNVNMCICMRVCIPFPLIPSSTGLVNPPCRLGK